MDCIFCKIINREIPSKIVYEDDLSLAFMDINPQSMGHVLIIPKEHIKDYTEKNEIINHLFKVANKIGQKIFDELNQTGYRLVINYGDAQEVKHLHLHIVPCNDETDYDINSVYEKIKMN